jgi:hypothetical protein
MSETEEKGGEKQDGFNASFSITGSASGTTIVKVLKRCRTWVAKNFLLLLVPTVVGAGGATGGYYEGSSSHAPEAQANVPASAPAAKPWVKFSSLVPGQSVARCTSLSGTALLPPGDHVYILDENLGSQDYYLKGTATTTPTATPPVVNWNYQATIGAANKGGNFDIVAIVVDDATNDFLSGILAAGNIQKVPGGVADSHLLTALYTKRVAVQRQADESTPCP